MKTPFFGQIPLAHFRPQSSLSEIYPERRPRDYLAPFAGATHHHPAFTPGTFHHLPSSSKIVPHSASVCVWWRFEHYHLSRSTVFSRMSASCSEIPNREAFITKLFLMSPFSWRSVAAFQSHNISTTSTKSMPSIPSL